MRAEAAGNPGPWRQQALLGRAPWKADALRDMVRDYAIETLSEPDAVLVVDKTGFLKQGNAPCGVAPIHGLWIGVQLEPTRRPRCIRLSLGLELCHQLAQRTENLHSDAGALLLCPL